MTSEKPSDEKTLDYLKNVMKIKTGFSKTSFRSGIPRPSFTPNGQIAFVSGKQIRVVQPVPPVTQAESLTSATVLKHTHVEEKNDQELGLKMLNLNIKDQPNDSQLMDTSMVCAQRTRFDDLYFYNMLRKELPRVAFCAKQDSSGTPLSKKQQLSFFLRDLAKDLVDESKNAKLRADQREKAKHEFIAVCMLNALFGNPNLHLVQLHPSYRGPKTLERDLGLYGKEEQTDEQSLLTLKKRRNAVCEVMRFQCTQTYKVDQCPARGASDEQIYRTALAMLENGDIKGAVKHLNSQKKSKLAMIVARSLNSSFSMQPFSYLQIGGNTAYFKEICSHITLAQGSGQHLKWDQKLLQSLLFSQQADQSLIDLIRSLEGEKAFQGTERLLWSLLKVYANCRDAEKSFKQFALDLTPACDQRDYRLRWVSQLVLTHALSIRNLENSGNAGMYGQKALIEDNFLLQTSSQYVRQLTAAKDYRSALLVSLMIPARFPVIRAKLIYQVLSLQASAMITQVRDQKDLAYIINELHLPIDWAKSAIALCLQNLNLYERAMEQWKQAGNMQEAHRIWHEKILPLYMNRGAGVQLYKALQFGDKMTQAQRVNLMRAQGICQRGEQVDQEVQNLAQNSALILDWDTKTGNFKKFIELLNKIAENGFSTGEVCRSYTSVIKSIQALSRDDDKDTVDHFIGQEIATISNFLQMTEDRENIKEGRDRSVGVTHYTGGSNQFKFQSDAAFVAQNQPRIAREAEQLVVSQLLNRVSTV